MTAECLLVRELVTIPQGRQRSPCTERSERKTGRRKVHRTKNALATNNYHSLEERDGQEYREFALAPQ